MSRLTTKSLKSAPGAGSSSLTVATGTGAWVSGSYVEFIASAADDLQIAGLIHATIPAAEWEVDVAIGAAASEVVVGTFRCHGKSGAASFPGLQPIIPFDRVPAGSRVALRSRHRGSSTENLAFTLVYYEALDGDNFTDGTLKSTPAAANGVSVTPSGTGWANSSWVELSPSLGEPIGAFGVAWSIGSGPSHFDIEFDVGIGAAASETVVATFRDARQDDDSGRLTITQLPWLVPIEAGERVAVRLRKSGTNTTAFSVALLHYNGFDLSTAKVGCAVFGVDTTVRATRAIAFGLDGATNVHDEVGKFKVFGDGEYTGTLEVITPTVGNHAVTKDYCDGNSTSIDDIVLRLLVTEDGALVLDDDGLPLYSE